MRGEFKYKCTNTKLEGGLNNWWGRIPSAPTWLRTLQGGGFHMRSSGSSSGEYISGRSLPAPTRWARASNWWRHYRGGATKVLHGAAVPWWHSWRHYRGGSPTHQLLSLPHLPQPDPSVHCSVGEECSSLLIRSVWLSSALCLGIKPGVSLCAPYHNILTQNQGWVRVMGVCCMVCCVLWWEVWVRGVVRGMGAWCGAVAVRDQVVCGRLSLSTALSAKNWAGNIVRAISTLRGCWADRNIWSWPLPICSSYTCTWRWLAGMPKRWPTRWPRRSTSRWSKKFDHKYLFHIWKLENLAQQPSAIEKECVGLILGGSSTMEENGKEMYLYLSSAFARDVVWVRSSCKVVFGVLPRHVSGVLWCVWRISETSLWSPALLRQARALLRHFQELEKKPHFTFPPALPRSQSSLTVKFLRNELELGLRVVRWFYYSHIHLKNSHCRTEGGLLLFVAGETNKWMQLFIYIFVSNN